ncbi:XRE family transcriptional regulator [Schinkia azotoformans]|uniref:XRE family transcriptional regulator n=1 Tax=Schinkia azotoformans TaxID=1454 RepID=UPI002DB6BB34|nr:XRE family transcriptional regulator [Schinkia azotoformans]MEC1714711.1 XRE family transcriptional regulator [Schinkia azotoformans]MEC1757533.1 XRE family transcriptional regulator [Schinkia azotoformans]
MLDGRTSKALKAGRNEVEMTQLELELDGIYCTREAISQQERGEYNVQPNVTKYFIEKHNNPWPALEAAAEYSGGWGPVKLDGDAADLHRTTVSMKTKEELREALESMIAASNQLTINPNAVDRVDIKVIEKSLLESIDAITALNHYVAVLCKEYRISWMKLWTQHKVKLIQRMFIKKG